MSLWKGFRPEKKGIFGNRKRCVVTRGGESEYVIRGVELNRFAVGQRLRPSIPSKFDARLNPLLLRRRPLLPRPPGSSRLLKARRPSAIMEAADSRFHVRAIIAKGAHHDAAAPSDDRGPDPPQPLSQDSPTLHQMGCRFRPALPHLARTPRARPRPLLSAPPRPGAKGLLERPQADPPALKFLYRVTLGRDEVVEKVACPKTPKKLPVVLSQDEIAQFLDALQTSSTAPCS